LDSLWYPNIGALRHIMHDGVNLSMKTAYYGSQNVKISNGTCLKIIMLVTQGFLFHVPQNIV